VQVALRRFDGQVHPFVLLGGLIDDANEARRWIGGQLRSALFVTGADARRGV
jgi:acetyl esterase